MLSKSLFLAERHTVSTLILGRIALMGAYKNTLQRTKVLTCAVVRALLNRALNALICMTIHKCFLLFR